MGITYSNLVFMAKAKNNNVCFNNVLTIGHQNLYLSNKQIKQLKKQYNLLFDESSFTNKQYCDDFFKLFFDSKEIKSLDYSNYEDCDIIHDMNFPINPNLNDKFDVVIDGGSLEHIFNFPVAIGNCMKMVKKKGSIFIFTAANNLMGHGFYQFSPEVFFRIFQPENGFKICEVVLEKTPFLGIGSNAKANCYSVIDPVFVKSRVQLISRLPVTIMIHAIRDEAKPIFLNYPIQSDYASKHNSNKKIQTIKIVKKIYNILPLVCKKIIASIYSLIAYSFLNKNFYKKWSQF